jgi:hypothetical protein
MRKYEGGTTTLENVDSEKDIGVTIDQHLNFEKHIQTEINKANQIVGLTRRKRNTSDFTHSGRSLM